MTTRQRSATVSLLVALVTALLAAVLAASPANASPASPTADAQAFVAQINGIRAANGVPPLAVDPLLSAAAAAWTDTMAGSNDISHNPNLANAVDAPWIALGENVGVGTDEPTLFQAFVDSPTHFANLVDPDYTSLGVAVRWGPDGRMYTTHLFMAVEAPAAAATAASVSPLRAAVVLDALRAAVLSG